MKLTYSLLAAAFACGFASAQTTAYTTPVGYVNTNLKAGQYSFLGLTLVKPTLAAGVVASATATSVTVAAGVDFTTLLTAGSTYILELPDGTVQEITSWSGSTLTTPENVSGFITPNVTTYKIRLCDTVSTVFGNANSVGLKASNDGDPTTADNLYVFSAPGVSTSVYYFDLDGDGIRDTEDGDGWYTGGGDPADNLVIPYPDAVIVQRLAGTDKTITISGELKTTPTKSVIGSGYNFLSSVAPVGLTLSTSGLSSYVTSSADGDPATCDNLIIDVSGVQTTVYFFDLNQNGTVDVADGDGWYTGGGDPADSYPLEGGFYIVNIGAAKAYKLNVPASYSGL